MSITPLHEAALASLKIAPKSRSKVEPGKHEVDFTVHVIGKVTVLEDHEARITASVPWQKMVAVLLSKLNGVTVESIVREALEGDIEDSEVKAEAADAMSEIIEPTARVRKGAVKTDLSVEEV